jgi:hypothetical protein
VLSGSGGLFQQRHSLRAASTLIPTLLGSEILLKYLMLPDKQMNRRQTLLAKLCKRPRTLRIAERQGLIAPRCYHRIIWALFRRFSVRHLNDYVSARAKST